MKNIIRKMMIDETCALLSSFDEGLKIQFAKSSELKSIEGGSQ